MLNVSGVKDGEYLEYKGRPLVRQDGDIYYGDLSDEYYVCMMILSEKSSSVKADETVPDNVVVQLINSKDKKIEKQIISSGLSDAFETADAWLERYNK
jgi:hypothetical protein